MAPLSPSRSSGSEVTRLDAHFAESRPSQPAETNSAIRIAALEAELEFYRANEHERTFGLQLPKTSEIGYVHAGWFFCAGWIRRSCHWGSHCRESNSWA